MQRPAKIVCRYKIPERKPVIGITCNFDYRDAVGMVSGMGITGQDWDFVSGEFVEAAGKETTA